VESKYLYDLYSDSSYTEKIQNQNKEINLYSDSSYTEKIQNQNKEINLYFDSSYTEKIQKQNNNKFAHDPPTDPSRYATDEMSMENNQDFADVSHSQTINEC
jgi:hypothetical protein